MVVLATSNMKTIQNSYVWSNIWIINIGKMTQSIFLKSILWIKKGSCTSSLWQPGSWCKAWIPVAWSVFWIKITARKIVTLSSSTLGTSHWAYKTNHTFFYTTHLLLKYSTYDQYQANQILYLSICLQKGLYWHLHLLSTFLSPNLQSNLQNCAILRFPSVH